MNNQVDGSPSYPRKITLTTNSSLAFFEAQDEDMAASISSFDQHAAFSQVILERLDPGDVFADIGASYGIDTIFASRIAREVYSFEQDLNKRSILESNIRNNQIRNATGFLYKIYDHPDLMGNASPVETSPGELEPGARQESIDHLIATGQIPAPTALKINVGGEEWFVLQGMRHLLGSERRPRILFLELHPARLIQHGKNFKEALDFIEKFGYVPVYQQNKFSQVQLIYEQRGTAAQPAKPACMLFVPSNDTHVSWMLPIAEQIPGANFMVIPSRGENAGPALENHGKTYYSYVAGLISVLRPSLIVLGIDWGAEELSILLEARLLEIPTACIQEGPLLFNQLQNQLSHADAALIQGEVMRKYVDNKNIFVVGNPKFDAYAVEKLPQAATVMINCNFTYGMYEDQRESWIGDVISACKQCGVEFFISQHPRDKGIFPSDLPVFRSNSALVKEQITRSSILISRFSTLIYEALLLGRRAIYYNPMREPYPIFENDNNGALFIAHDLSELTRCMRQALAEPEIPGAMRSEYLQNHCGMAESKAAVRCATVLQGIAGGDIPIAHEKRVSTASLLADALQSLELGDLQKSVSWLEETRKKDLEAIEELRAGNAWLDQMRKKDLEAIEELKAGNQWLEEMHTKDLATIEELQKGNAWLEEMRKKDLEAIEELRKGNEWLEQVHARDMETIESLQAKLAPPDTE